MAYLFSWLLRPPVVLFMTPVTGVISTGRVFVGLLLQVVADPLPGGWPSDLRYYSSRGVSY